MSTPVRAIAFYLPQYHPIPANDKWWGKGFTEWANVANARPLFEGHYQPHFPADLGFYDLRVPEVREQQAELAKNAGIEGFCYWHYWFGNGQRALERIFDEVVLSGRPDFPFCLGWANESWTGRWHGLDNEVIFAQTYPGVEDYGSHFMALLPSFLDRRYIEVEGRKLFIIYRPAQIPNLKEFVDCWNALARKHGFNKFFFISGDFNASGEPFEELDGVFFRSLGDIIEEHREPPNNVRFIHRVRRIMARVILRRIGATPAMPLCCSYETFVRHLGAMALQDNVYPCAIPNWDTTPRCGARGQILRGSTPALFASLVRMQIEKLSNRAPQRRLLFIKSWNEWAEGNYLEPDKQFGHQYLDALKSELMGQKFRMTEGNGHSVKKN